MNPVRSGFRAVLRRPAVIAGEIAWRWAFGAAAWALLFLALRDIFARIDVSEAEYYLSRRSDAFLAADACARILIQVLPQLARAALVLIPALTLVWIVAATVGRAATLRALCHDPTLPLPFAGVQGRPHRERQGWSTGCYGSLFALNAVRAVLTLAAVAAFFGTVILVSRLWPQPAHPVGAALAWLLLAALVGFCWSVVNWFLSLAPIFVVCDGRGTAAAMAESMALYRRAPGSSGATVFWFGLLRTLALMAAFVFAFFAAAASSPRAAVVLSISVALLYFAVADLLYIARLAAFLSVAAPAEALVEKPLEQ